MTKYRDQGSGVRGNKSLYPARGRGSKNLDLLLGKSLVFAGEGEPCRRCRLWAIIPVFCLLFSACGFSPIYASQGSGGEPVDKALSNVAIANIADRQGQILRNHLIDRMYFSGRPVHPDATLNVTVRSTESDLGIQKDATASRRELNMWADYTLNADDGRQLLKGKAHSVVSFSKLDAQYGTVAAQQNATERALNEMGEQIVNRLSLYYAEKS